MLPAGLGLHAGAWQHVWGLSSPVRRSAYACTNSFSSVDNFYLNRKHEGCGMCTSTNPLEGVAAKEGSQTF